MTVEHPCPNARSMRTEIILTTECLRMLGAAWQRLWRDQDGSIFQSHEWISAWWHNIDNQQSHRLRIGVLWEGERLLAVIPLVICHRKGFRFLEWAGIVHTDYGDILTSTDCPQSELTALWKTLVDYGGFDIYAITRVAPNSAAADLFDDISRTAPQIARGMKPEISYRVRREGQDGTAWYNSLSKKMRKTHRHGYNVLERAGEVQFRRVSDDVLEPVLTRLSRLKQKSLKNRGISSQLFVADMRLLTAFVDVISRLRKLHIFVLELDNSACAISVNFEEHDTMMCWVTTFDASITQASPGLMLIVEYIRWSFDRGISCVDFLSGGEAFKTRFSNHAEELQSFTGHRTLKGLLGLRLHKLRERFTNF
ncbi:GNAT family N-acetyltransferase [Rhizobium oryzicola]|uniref:GNAT family N-acetyltransferase n=1 Tax=Rhizobium oryzicola TaxID=1232668 RepID=A0ABT8SWM5_9HYPH|nr:GNAT family N-acetyltransferase [Rhizobium oryzicola]MDO1582838.1 GNAT family N-acetyltransferase [Rhizobium oryzicola]